ncbi:MBL fold metallo-hydrolase [Kribbella sp. NPDC049584]|uniref:ComEC/Rec2 family competence protein n=1 Tax=Kribbella sp. NPDC049584 TaxID=3154833 RepID=UPI00341865CA
MYEIDFLPVESANGPGSKSGDAIAMRFSVGSDSAVVVIDGGFTDTGDDLAAHIKKYYETAYIDLMISTHPDADHINGLARLMEQTTVGELLVHRPRLHARDVTEFSNIEAVDNLIKVATDAGVKVTEPFTGLTRFGDQIRILGPTEAYYEDLLTQSLDQERSGFAAKSRLLASLELSSEVDFLKRFLQFMPEETLTDEVETSPRNSTSVITLLTVDGHRFMFTGDAGIQSLEKAADEYERVYGAFNVRGLKFFQGPHHGSRRNLGPTILDRMFGTESSPFGSFDSIISSAKASTKHPSPKVVNALKRRGGRVYATEGTTICEPSIDAPSRGWITLDPLPTLVEDDDAE